MTDPAAIPDFQTITAVVAHPDDEVLGCGGLIARATRAGIPTQVLIVSGATSSRQHTRVESLPINETANAMKILGVEHWTILGFPDNRLDTIPFLDLIQKVEACLSATRPELVLTHDGSDLNLDHRLVHQAVLTACRPIDATPRAIYGFETLSSSEWQDPSLQHFRPTVFVDIAEVLAIKLEAMACYQSELRDFPHPRSIEGIRIRAAQRGMEVGRSHAEAFRLIRQIW
jgi:LmbE family N-acetylglucosaminyl deacetylase